MQSKTTEKRKIIQVKLWWLFILALEAPGVMATALRPEHIVWNVSGSVCNNAFNYSGIDNSNPWSIHLSSWTLNTVSLYYQ